MPLLSNKGTRKGGLAVPVALACVLQVALAPQIQILGGRFVFVAAAACALAPGLAPGTAALMGFGLGLFFDLTATTPVGLMALLLSLASFALATGSGGHALGFSANGIRLTGVAAFVLVMLYGLAVFFLGVESDFVYAVFVHGLSSAVLTVLASLPFLALASSDAGPGFSLRPRTGTRFKGLR